jgi:hypothetical protein
MLKAVEYSPENFECEQEKGTAHRPLDDNSSCRFICPDQEDNISNHVPFK